MSLHVQNDGKIPHSNLRMRLLSDICRDSTFELRKSGTAHRMASATASMDSWEFSLRSTYEPGTLETALRHLISKSSYDVSKSRDSKLVTRSAELVTFVLTRLKSCPLVRCSVKDSELERLSSNQEAPLTVIDYGYNI